MSKIDLKKEYKNLYNPSSKEVSIVDVPEFNYLMIDGKGSPGEAEEYTDAISTLFPVAYKIKFMHKTINPEKDYAVMPLEGLWWADNMNDFKNNIRDNWKWTLMIMQPDFITENLFHKAIEEVKKKNNIKSLGKLKFQKYKEGQSCQIMHIGPYSEEGANIHKIHDHILKSGHRFDGHQHKHHEIYISDFRKVAPEKCKTVLRQPFV